MIVWTENIKPRALRVKLKLIALSTVFSTLSLNPTYTERCCVSAKETSEVLLWSYSVKENKRKTICIVYGHKEAHLGGVKYLCNTQGIIGALGSTLKAISN